MKPFSIDLLGRIKNFNLPKNQPLVPLFEAVVNSIHAIQERRDAGESFEGKITIRIIRETQMSLSDIVEAPAIQSFEDRILFVSAVMVRRAHQRDFK